MAVLFKNISYLLLLILFATCTSKKEQEQILLFELVDKSVTGIDFRNDLTYDEKFNPYTFRNFYNGAGVALGDINNDGLVDIFLAGNQTENKLYLNKGNFEFEDITEMAGLAVPGIWSTGVSMADVNGDGLLDIYICKSGPLGGKERYNSLYINNGDLTFTEMAHEYGLADEGLSQHAVFFDYDNDGDLDMYLLNNSARSIGANDLRTGQREIRDALGGNKLYKNDNGKFVDVSEEAGIYGSAIGYGLGVTVADLNKDGWPDLYVSNDFFEKDYLYFNNGDGTFTEALEDVMTEISMGSMGADIADLNNDGWQDVFVTEMLPATLDRVKTKTPFEEWDRYQANVKAGYFHQFTRNTLQRNLGYQPNSDKIHFTEISRFSGVHATDWSWGALIFDMDNDGYKDIFVANGIVKDLTDFDFVDYYDHNQALISQNKRDSVLLTSMLNEFPSTPLQNYLFKNRGNFQFEDVAGNSGMDQLTFSTGAAYADLDNDGDLDLVINNLNGDVSIFKNNSRELNGNAYIQFDLGSQFGTQVTVYTGKAKFFAEHNPVKGYMSSVDPRLHFGLGQIDKVDSIYIGWPNKNLTILKDQEVNQLLKINQNDAVPFEWPRNKIENQTFHSSNTQIDWKHQENDFVDFDRDRLRFHMISNEGPKIIAADIDSNGLEDLFLPGARGQASTIYKQTRNGDFKLAQTFDSHAAAEDVGGLFFDANGNGHLDLYVLSGSLEYGDKNQFYQDRLYLNDGKGNFSLTTDAIPQRYEPSSFVVSCDYNQDGHTDLIVGTRTTPFAYGVPGDLRLLENQGDGKFVDKTREISPEFEKLGMTRDAWMGDLDGDGADELVVVGEWMPIKVFKISPTKITDVSEQFGFANTGGLWNTVHVADVNGNGQLDILVGNVGLNTRLKASVDQPLRMYVNDFDQNGSIEQLITMYEGEEAYPIVLKNALLKQLPGLRKQLLTYDAYKDKRMEDLFPESILNSSIILEVHTLETKLYINEGNGMFTSQPLPPEIQYSEVFAINTFQDSQGYRNAIFGGNQSRIKPELGINMGSFGWHVKFDESPTLISTATSGLYVSGEIRSFVFINNKNQLVVGRNNETLMLFDMSKDN